MSEFEKCPYRRDLQGDVKEHGIVLSRIDTNQKSSLDRLQNIETAVSECVALRVGFQGLEKRTAELERRAKQQDTYLLKGFIFLLMAVLGSEVVSKLVFG